MQIPHCFREIFAHGPTGSVEVCSCGTVQVTIGAVTVRVVPEALAELADIVGQAALEISRRSATRGVRQLEPGVLS